MKKLKLNKKTISQMNNNEMENVNGGFLGICLSSCPRGSRKGKSCCETDDYDDYDLC